MDIWEKLYQEARRVQGNRVISPFMRPAVWRPRS